MTKIKVSSRIPEFSQFTYADLTSIAETLLRVYDAHVLTEAEAKYFLRRSSPSDAALRAVGYAWLIAKVPDYSREWDSYDVHIFARAITNALRYGTQHMTVFADNPTPFEVFAKLVSGKFASLNEVKAWWKSATSENYKNEK